MGTSDLSNKHQTLTCSLEPDILLAFKTERELRFSFLLNYVSMITELMTGLFILKTHKLLKKITCLSHK